MARRPRKRKQRRSGMLKKPEPEDDKNNATEDEDKENRKRRPSYSDDDCVILSYEPPRKRACQKLGGPESSKPNLDGSVHIVDEVRPSSDLVKKARDLGLPDTFYNYLQAEPQVNNGSKSSDKQAKTTKLNN